MKLEVKETDRYAQKRLGKESKVARVSHASIGKGMGRRNNENENTLNANF